ncbi:corticotropin releasing hormone b [Esox lucius]|uniref:Corticotropin-releasing factor domain-containing protein n=1 Tax=Esox lucius TaxID=8010 RepID=A0AAY5L0U9_ESOLU|nr:corticotropin releasing hormone b [Esox lucius]
MKLNLFVTTVVLLVAFLPRHECRAIDSPGSVQRATAPEPDAPSLPLLTRLGEEYYIRLGNGNRNSAASEPKVMNPEGSYNQGLQLQLTQRLLQSKVGSISRFISGLANQLDDSVERGRRSDDPPISLDLTFHMLRQMMEMSRAEQLQQQAHSNRKMMEIFGK